MKEREIPDFWCPKCGKLASVLEPFIRPSFARFALAYFACGDCGLIYFNKSVIKRLLREWYRLHGYKRRFSEFWRKVDAHIEESKKAWQEKGWKLAVFKRKALSQK